MNTCLERTWDTSLQSALQVITGLKKYIFTAEQILSPNIKQEVENTPDTQEGLWF